MKAKAKAALFLFCFAALLVSYNDCTNNNYNFGTGSQSSQATNTGNPLTPVSMDLIFAVCGVVTRCHTNVTLDQCRAGILATAGFNVPLNLPSNFSTMSSVAQGEQSGLLIGNSSVAGSCYDAINALSCSAPQAQTSYVSGIQNPFSGAVDLVSGPGCNAAFAPSAQYSCSSQIFLRNVAGRSFAPVSPASGTTYQISPPLPAGLSLDPNTGVISGTPTVVSPAAQYTVTATNAYGSTASTINLRAADGYLVDDTSDAHNVGPGCLSSNGKCTLRAAVEEIDATKTSNVIVLPAGQINLTLASELAVSTGMDIYGDCAAGTTIDGQAAARVFHLTSGPTSLQNLTVQNGSDGNLGGGGVFADGGNGGFSAALQNVVFQNNKYTGSANGGGGLFASGPNAVSLTLNQCSFLGNSAPAGNGGGLFIEKGTQLTASNLIFQNNSAGDGGAIDVDGTAQISQSLIADNAASGHGGGLYCSSNTSGGQVTLTNDTFYQNTAAQGGGVAGGNAGLVSLINSTVVGNSATSMVNPYGGGLDTSNGGSFTVSNSIVTGNSNNSNLVNCYGAVASKGYNLTDGSDCAFTAAGDQINTRPLLGPLQANGGYSETLALLPTSPGIDQANSSACPAVDQRGAPRLSDGKCDIGAFESQ